jgi:hypothetical protein
LRAGNFCAWLLNRIGARELLIEGQTDSLDGDVGGARLFEEGSKGMSVRFVMTCLANDEYLRILAGTYPPPPMAIMRFGLNSSRILGAETWHSLWTWDTSMSVAAFGGAQEPDTRHVCGSRTHLIVSDIDLFHHFER